MKIISKYYILIIGLIVFSGYILTIAPSLVEGDSGELAAAQANLGVAHPSGYPLFVLMGYLFIKIPFFTPVFKSNLLAMLCTLGSVLMFALNLKVISRKFKLHESLFDEEKINLIVILSALIFAFSRTLWAQAVSVEVYSLHILLVNIILYFFMKALPEEGRGEFTLNKNWILFAVFLGFAFTNHLATTYLIPGLAVLFFLSYRFSLKNMLNLAKLIPVVVLPIVLMLSFMMFRASQSPEPNWGNPSNLKSLFYHISGLQYRGFAFSKENSFMQKLGYFFSSLNFNGEFGIFLLLGLIGVYFFFKKAHKLAFTLLVFFVTAVIFSANYGINDIDSYFLLAYLSIAFFIFGGVIFVLRALPAESKFRTIATALGAVLLVLEFSGNFKQVDQSNVYLHDDFVDAVFSNVKPGSIIYCNEKDPFVLSSFYYQDVLGKRKDVLQVIVPMMSEKWYVDWLNTKARGCFYGYAESLKINTKDRPVYFSYKVVRDGQVVRALGLSEKDLVPDYMLFRKVSTGDSKYVPSNYHDYKFRLSGKRTSETDMIESYILAMSAARLSYEHNFGKTDEANQLLKDMSHVNLRIDINKDKQFRKTSGK